VTFLGRDEPATKLRFVWVRVLWPHERVTHERANLYALSSIDDVRPNDVVVLKLEGNDTAFHRARIWMAEKRFIHTEWFVF